MTVEEAIKSRRSIRKYEDREITDDIIEKLINAGRLAPTGNNAQPQRYKIIKDDETKQKLKENNVFKQNFVYKAPLIIACFGDPEAYPKLKIAEGFDEPYPIRATRDVAIAAENIALRATELGLGSCFVGWVARNRIKKVLNIPESFVIPFVITLGYTAEKPKGSSRKNLDEFILKR